jgi:hypothetical protein
MFVFLPFFYILLIYIKIFNALENYSLIVFGGICLGVSIILITCSLYFFFKWIHRDWVKAKQLQKRGTYE